MSMIENPQQIVSFAEQYPRLFTKIVKNLAPLQDRRRGIGIDLDGVTHDTFAHILTRVSHDFKYAYHKSDWTHYWWLLDLAKINGISQEECLSYALAVCNNDQVYSQAEPMSGARPFLRLMHEIEQKLQVPYWFVSSRPKEYRQTTKDWFREKFVWVDPNSIVIRRPKHMSGPKYKSRIVKWANIGLVFEDSPDEAIAMAEAGALTVLVPQPWNNQITINHPRVVQLSPNCGDVTGLIPVINFLTSPNLGKLLA